MSQNFTLCSPCRISARELCELNEEGDWRIASWIRLVPWSALIGRSLPRAYWVRRVRAMSRKRLLVMAAFLGAISSALILLGASGPIPDTHGNNRSAAAAGTLRSGAGFGASAVSQQDDSGFAGLLDAHQAGALDAADAVFAQPRQGAHQRAHAHVQALAQARQGEAVRVGGQLGQHPLSQRRRRG